MSRLNSQLAWGGLGTAALLLCAAFVPLGLSASPRDWHSNLMFTAYGLLVAAGAFGYCCGAKVRFPVLGERRRSPPEFPIMEPPPPDDDSQSEVRQALDLHPTSDLQDGLAAALGGQRQLYRYCAKCGYPLDRPRLTPDCNGGAACAKRRHTPLADRLKASGPTSPLRVHPDWIAEHPGGR